jgi:hypothetical protein
MKFAIVSSRLAAASLAGALLLAPAFAADPAPAEQDAGVPGWNEFVDSLRELPTSMLAKLPQAQRNDPQIRAEIGRLALEALTSSAIGTLGSDPDHPAFVGSISYVLNVGQPNADTHYWGAKIRPGGVYRLRGLQGTLRYFRLQQGRPLPKGPLKGALNLGPQKEHLDLNALHSDAQGRFDVLVSAARPAGYTGDWWQLDPETDNLLLRRVSDDWDTEVEPTVSIERLDAPVERPRSPAAVLEQRLRELPQAVAFIGSLFVDHVEQLRRDGWINKIKEFDVSHMSGVKGQFYYEGSYELKDDEALIVEAKLPEKCLYRSIILTNYLYETTDWYNNHSSLNDAQSQGDKDGIIRFVVSARDPGVPNWLDTAGYPTGVIQGRWTDCDSQPIPSVRKVALKNVRKFLPKQTATVTREEREKIIRARRAALLQKPLW